MKNFLSFPRIWLAVLFKPSTATFEKEKSNIKFAPMLVWIGLVGCLSITNVAFLKEGWRPPNVLSFVLAPFAWGFIVTFGYITVQIILQWLSRLFGGNGNFISQAYLVSLGCVPLAILNLPAAWLPQPFDTILNFILLIYLLFLLTLALRVAHGYSSVRAILTWLFPFLLLFACIVFFVLRINFVRS